MLRLVEYGIFDQDCVRVANAVRNLGAETFLCLKVPTEVVVKLQESMPNLNLVLLDAFDETRLATLVQLHHTSVKYKDLILSDATRYLEDVFVIEGNELDLTAVIAVNLAVAHGGRIVFANAASKDDVDYANEQSRLWSNGSFEERQHARDALIHFLQSRLPGELLASRTIKSISFITRGLPYGILPFSCPTTHFFSFPLLGLSVLAGMLKSQELFRCPVAVLIDPSLVGRSEFAVLRETFGKAGYLLRPAFGQNATARNASFLTAYLPSDFIFYSTHCGEEKGQKVIERFPDRNGNFHAICYERVLSGFHSPTEERDDLYEITVMMRWVSIDGIDWSDEAKKEEIKARELLKDYIDYSRNRKNSETKPDLISVTDSGCVGDSDSLAMCGLNYLPLPHVVGAGHYPIVFNNACSSWRALAVRFSCGGASVYVGTATDILNSVGVLTANKFVNEITSGRAVGLALYRAQKKFIGEFKHTPYLMSGYLYTKLNNPSVKQRHHRVMLRIFDAIKAADRLPASDGKSAMLKFLKDELRALGNVEMQI